MGDAGEAEEQALLDSGVELKADLIKVGHHGSSGSSSAALLEQVAPAWAVISVGAGNDFGHPHAATLDRLAEAGAQVLRTDLYGDLVAVSDGATLRVIDAPWDDVATGDDAGKSGIISGGGSLSGTGSADTGYYIGNVNTHKFHLPSCGTLPAEENRIMLASREQAIAA